MRTAIALALCLASVPPASATDKSDVLAVVHSWVDSFNKGEGKSALSHCADESSIIDDFPPYEWQGTGACNTWFNDVNAWLKKNDATFDHSAIDKVRHVQVTADRAYVVLAATFATRVNGATNSEKGVWTFSMKKERVWRITGWTWTAS